jgi:hypothetical protein
MKRNNGKDAGQGPSLKVTLAGLLVAILLFPGIAPAAKKKSGRTLALTLKTGGVVNGELLTVKDDRLVIFDANSLIGQEVRIGDVSHIRVVKKSRFLPGLGLGLLIGGAGGALIGICSGDGPSGWFAFTAREKALLGAAGLGSLGVIIGGIAGAIAGIDESLGTGSLPPAALDELLGKLKKYSRGAGEVPPTVSVVPAPVSTEGARLAEKETQPALAANQGQEPGQPVPADKYCRLHLSLGLGYFRSSGTSQLKNLIKDIGFTASESITFGNTVIIEYPDVMHNPTLLFNDIKVEYSLSRKFALGLVYAPLGEHTVSGRQVIPGKDYRDSYLPETYFIGSYRGRMFFLTASYFPIPDAFLKKTSVKVTAGIGFGKLAVDYYGAEYSSSYQDPSP